MLGRLLLGVEFSAIIVLLIIGTAYAASCTQYEWAPSQWTSLDIYKSENEAKVGNWFYWDNEHMDAFKNLNAYYQYEIRRSKEVWDYWRSNCPWGCTGYYWTNLPNPTTTWSEENDPPWCCFSKIGDEEFEIKSEDIEALQANYWYGGYAWFLRDSGEENTLLNVETQSEYCGTGPLCDFGQTFGWCTMTSDDVTS
jgi:hypothetical protein